jgi:hypothetical protein
MASARSSTVQDLLNKVFINEIYRFSLVTLWNLFASRIALQRMVNLIPQSVCDARHLAKHSLPQLHRFLTLAGSLIKKLYAFLDCLEINLVKNFACFVK